MAVKQIKQVARTDTFGAPSSITPTFDSNGFLSLSCASVPGAVGYVWRGMWEEDALNVDDPWKWWELTPRPIPSTVLNRMNSPLVSAFAWDGEIITVQVAAVDKDGTQSAWASLTFTAPGWTEGPAVSHWSRDFTKQTANGSGLLAWKTNASTVTVGGTAGSQTLTFSQASQTWEQTVPTHPLGGRQYDIYVDIQGTNGQTIQVFSNSGGGADNWAQTITLDGTRQVLRIQRADVAGGNTDRTLRFGLQTYGGATARVVTVYNLMLLPRAASTPAQNTTITNRVWLEPMLITGAGTYSSWHKSETSTTHQTQIGTTGAVVLTGRYDGLGVLCRAPSGGASVDIKGVRSRARNPMAAGKLHGYIFQGDNVVRLVVQNNFFRHHCAISTQNWRGRGAGNTYIVTDNIVLDIDGRYILDGTGAFRLSSWGNNQNPKPGGVLSGWEAEQFIRLNQMENAGVDPDGVTGADFARNLVINRPGHSRSEDLLNFSRFRGTPSSWIQVHANCIWGTTPWDWTWHQANDLTKKYNYGQILTTFTVAVTTTASAAQGAITIPVSALSGRIVSGATIAFSNGVTTTARGTTAQGATTLNVNALSGAVPIGATATVTSNDGRTFHSGTAILVSDMFGNNVGTANGSFEQNSAYIRVYDNVGIGEGAYIGAQSGNNLVSFNNTIYYSGYLYGGTVQSSGHRVPSIAYNNFNYNGTTATDRNGISQTIQFNTNAYNNKVFGGLAIDQSAMQPSTEVFANVRVATCTPNDERQALADWYQREIIQRGYTLGPS